MRFAATTANPVAHNLARFATALLVYAATIQVPVQPCHIKGKFNQLADFLSCSKAGHTPSWERVIAQCYHLCHCRICLVPRELLLLLA
jgi:hypothetical protein